MQCSAQCLSTAIVHAKVHVFRFFISVMLLPFIFLFYFFLVLGVGNRYNYFPLCNYFVYLRNDCSYDIENNVL